MTIEYYDKPRTSEKDRPTMVEFYNRPGTIEYYDGTLRNEYSRPSTIEYYDGPMPNEYYERPMTVEYLHKPSKIIGPRTTIKYYKPKTSTYGSNEYYRNLYEFATDKFVFMNISETIKRNIEQLNMLENGDIIDFKRDNADYSHTAILVDKKILLCVHRSNSAANEISSSSGMSTSSGVVKENILDIAKDKQTSLTK